MIRYIVTAAALFVTASAMSPVRCSVLDCPVDEQFTLYTCPVCRVPLGAECYGFLPCVEGLSCMQIIPAQTFSRDSLSTGPGLCVDSEKLQALEDEAYGVEADDTKVPIVIVDDPDKVQELPTETGEDDLVKIPPAPIVAVVDAESEAKSEERDEISMDKRIVMLAELLRNAAHVAKRQTKLSLMSKKSD